MNRRVNESALPFGATGPQSAGNLVSLQLPYDRLKTPLTRDNPTSLPAISIPRATANTADGHAKSASQIVSSLATLFYRYSGQPRIPLTVSSNLLSGWHQPIEILLETRGQDSLRDLQERVERNIGSDSVSGANESSSAVKIHIDRDAAMNDESAGERDNQQSTADLYLRVSISDSDWALTLTYNASLFDQITAKSLLRHLTAIVDVADRSPHLTIADIELLTANERQWIEEQCKGRLAAYPSHAVHTEFESFAAKSPKKIAVRHGSVSLTYDELNTRANQLARYMQQCGVAPATCVAMCLDPSLDVAITLLAIFKLGATYVPINPDYPALHVEAILEDTNPAIIVTRSHLLSVVDAASASKLCLDDPPDGISDLVDTDLGSSIHLCEVAYIYYTSGTTGRPKGATVSYDNMRQLIYATRDQFGISEDEVMLAVASLTFSISMFELMSPLSAGGTLIIVDRAHVLDPAKMAETLQQVTMAHLGPSLLKGLLRYINESVADTTVYDSVRHISTGGDMVPPELLQQLCDVFAKAEVFDIYCCSEIAITGTYWEVRDRIVSRTYVGTPFANVHLLILDDDGNQVPIGAIGDVCFGSPGVVSGYLNRPDLTLKQFFERQGLRYYRTGDRGRLNREGNLELLGRRDFQIQLRGMRIELAEIEYHLRHAHGIRDAVVAARKRGDGEDVLVAYFVPEVGQDLNPGKLREHLVDRLPDYMVPSFYMQLDALPLNQNMKVDRKALPDYRTARTRVGDMPLTDTEKVIARMWCDLLHLDFVSTNDNLMLLGGDSLLAMQFMMLVEKRFDCRIDGLEILRESLAVLARFVEERAGIVGNPEPQPSTALTRTILPSTSLFFGPENSLYGIHQHAAHESDIAPVLICPAVGYEAARSQFLLQILAEGLALAGVPSLRFDFYGSGDSLGKSQDASFDRWRSDIVAAAQELRRQSGTTKCQVFSLRLSVMLAFQALGQESISRWTCWDPVVDGESHYRELRRMHEEKVHRLLPVRNLKTPIAPRSCEELVGTTFASNVISEIREAKLQPKDIPVSADVVQILAADCPLVGSSDSTNDEASLPFRTVCVEDACRWYQSTWSTTAITHKSLLNEILAAVTGSNND